MKLTTNAEDELSVHCSRRKSSWKSESGAGLLPPRRLMSWEANLAGICCWFIGVTSSLAGSHSSRHKTRDCCINYAPPKLGAVNGLAEHSILGKQWHQDRDSVASWLALFHCVMCLIVPGPSAVIIICTNREKGEVKHVQTYNPIYSSGLVSQKNHCLAS